MPVTEATRTVWPPLVVGLGEVLWDLLPAGKSLGGAPANAAFHAGQLGARSVVVSAVGRDELGEEVAGRFGQLGLSAEYLRSNDRPTGTVSVEIRQGQPSYTIHTDVAWDELAFDASTGELAGQADAVCYGSLAQRHPTSRQTVQQFLHATRRDCWRVFDINLRGSFYDVATIHRSLAAADVLKLNSHELARVAQLLELPGDEASTIERLFGRYPLRLIALTRGEQGSSLFGRQRVSHQAVHPAEVVDTVGAGDSFTAALTMGLLRFRDLDAIHDHAARVAAFVCSRRGATPSLPPELRGGAG